MPRPIVSPTIVAGRCPKCKKGQLQDTGNKGARKCSHCGAVIKSVRL